MTYGQRDLNTYWKYYCNLKSYKITDLKHWTTIQNFVIQKIEKTLDNLDLYTLSNRNTTKIIDKALF